MKKLIMPVIAIVFAFAFSAFTAKRSTSNFYIYTSSSFAKGDIQNINNYVASDGSCGGAQDVCGVTLSTSQTLGSTPVLSEFNGEKTNLWLSEQNSNPADGSIQMQN